MALSLFVVKSVLSSLACFSKPNKLMNAIITIEKSLIIQSKMAALQRLRQGHLEEKSFHAGFLIY